MFRILITIEQQQYRFLLRGSSTALAELILGVEKSGGTVTIGDVNDEENLPLVVASQEEYTIPEDLTDPWLVWDRANLPKMQQLALESGALCVLPASWSTTAFIRALNTAYLVRNSQKTMNMPSQERRFEKGALIHLEEDRVLLIRRGVVRCSSIHPDGSEVLIGFYGKGDILMAHANYTCLAHHCHVEMRAHTTMTVDIESWQVAVNRPHFYDHLKQRVCQMELWSSMQAIGNAEDRLLGMLKVIAGRFSKQEGNNIVLEIKLTHEQLASAIGATRTTVTRLLGKLREKGLVDSVKTSMGDYLVLTTKIEPCQH